MHSGPSSSSSGNIHSMGMSSGDNVAYGDGEMVNGYHYPGQNGTGFKRPQGLSGGGGGMVNPLDPSTYFAAPFPTPTHNGDGAHANGNGSGDSGAGGSGSNSAFISPTVHGQIPTHAYSTPQYQHQHAQGHQYSYPHTMPQPSAAAAGQYPSAPNGNVNGMGGPTTAVPMAQPQYAFGHGIPSVLGHAPPHIHPHAAMSHAQILHGQHTHAHTHMVQMQGYPLEEWADWEDEDQGVNWPMSGYGQHVEVGFWCSIGTTVCAYCVGTTGRGTSKNEAVLMFSRCDTDDEHRPNNSKCCNIGSASIRNQIMR